MKKLTKLVSRLMRDTCGQDLIEYALMAGFVAVAAAAIMPGVAKNLDAIFRKVLAWLDDVPYVAQVTGDPHSDTIRVGFAIVAIVLLGLIVIRRKKLADDY